MWSAILNVGGWAFFYLLHHLLRALGLPGAYVLCRYGSGGTGLSLSVRRESASPASSRTDGGLPVSFLPGKACVNVTHERRWPRQVLVISAIRRSLRALTAQTVLPSTR